MQSSAPVQGPPTTNPPNFGSLVPMRRNWRPIAGAVKMTALVLEGVGVIVSGVSIGFLVNAYNNPTAFPATTLTSFLNTLESGIIIAGVGVILLGIGWFLDSI